MSTHAEVQQLIRTAHTNVRKYQDAMVKAWQAAGSPDMFPAAGLSGVLTGRTWQRLQAFRWCRFHGDDFPSGSDNPWYLLTQYLRYDGHLDILRAVENLEAVSTT